MKKISLILILVICILALTACTIFESHTLPKGKAEDIWMDAHNLLIDSPGYGMHFENAEFEYISENLIKITTSNGDVGYYSANELKYMEGVTFYD